MKEITNLLFQAKMLKEIPRSGYHYLGAGHESIAEHTFVTTFIAYVMTQLESGIDALRLISMALVHDLAEARMGDLNTVQKEYVTADEHKAVSEMSRRLPFGGTLSELIDEFNAGQTVEAKLVKDADQLSFILDLKALSDIGYKPPHKWLPAVVQRLQTDAGKKLAETILNTAWDEWWLKKYLDSSGAVQ